MSGRYDTSIIESKQSCNLSFFFFLKKKNQKDLLHLIAKQVVKLLLIEVLDTHFLGTSRIDSYGKSENTVLTLKKEIL